MNYQSVRAKILMVVTAAEANIFDQRFIELGLLEHKYFNLKAIANYNLIELILLVWTYKQFMRKLRCVMTMENYLCK